MTPLVAIVGRPNVGKSTLFNRLTKTRQALVDDLPGVTRDRLYGKVQSGDRAFTLIDTGGFDPPEDQDFAHEVQDQIEAAMAEADVILFLADGRQGINPLDFEVAKTLRGTQKPVILAVNKLDNPQMEDGAGEFHALGLERVHFISSAHGRGINDLLQEIDEALPPQADELEAEGDDRIRVTLLGRPNVGKSSLLNALVGEHRVVVSDVPGTTRDAIDTSLEKNGKKLSSGGHRRHPQAGQGGQGVGKGRGVPRPAGTGAGPHSRGSGGCGGGPHRSGPEGHGPGRGGPPGADTGPEQMGPFEKRPGRPKTGQGSNPGRAQVRAIGVPVMTLSAKTGKGVDKLLPMVDRVFAAYSRRMDTGPLNKALSQITARHQPPMVKGRRLKFYYATQVGTRPPTVVLFVNDPKAVHFSYRRYLNNELRKALGLDVCALRLRLSERSGRKPVRRPRSRS